MGFFSTGTVAGFSRADGVTARTVTMNRISSLVNGFIARESGALSTELAQTFTHRTFEEKSRAGVVIRVVQTLWNWPYDLPSAPGVVAGVVTWNRNGLHIPANCPLNVVKDIREQMRNMTASTAGTISEQIFYGPLILGIPAL